MLSLKNCTAWVLLGFTQITPALGSDLDEILLQAYEKSPRLKLQYSQAKAAKSEQLSQSVFVENPELYFMHQNIPLSTWPSPSAPMSMVTVGISQTIAFPWESKHRKLMFAEKFLSENEMSALVRDQLTYDVTAAYHELQFNRAKGRFLQQNRELLKSILIVSKSLTAIKEGQVAALLRVRADLGRLDNEIFLARAAENDEQAKIQSLAGGTIAWGKLAKSGWMDGNTTLVGALAFDYAQHPLYRLAMFRYQTAHHHLDHEKGSLFPAIKLNASYSFRQELPGRDTGEDFISIGASAPLPLYYGLKEKADEIRLKLEAAWQADFMRAHQLQLAFNNLKSVTVPAYKAAYEAEVASLATGASDIIDVLQGNREYLRALLDQAEVFRDLSLTRAKLDYLRSSASAKPQQEHSHE